jgi:uncharacterized protein (UPF0332 family)
MELEHRWLTMADETNQAAKIACDQGLWRSATSRAYYTAFQAATAMLHHSKKVQPPIVDQQQREAWSHEILPEMFRFNLRQLIQNKSHRNKLASSIGRLRTLRISADYYSEIVIDERQARLAVTEAGILLNLARHIID